MQRFRQYEKEAGITGTSWQNTKKFLNSRRKNEYTTVESGVHVVRDSGGKVIASSENTPPSEGNLFTSKGWVTQQFLNLNPVRRDFSYPA
jgi:hypothetical protein